jgi:hypothetical protein
MFFIFNEKCMHYYYYFVSCLLSTLFIVYSLVCNRSLLIWIHGIYIDEIGQEPISNAKDYH